MGTYLITGANRGIGLEYCRQLKLQNHDVIAVCRNTSPELDALGVRVITGIDITSVASVEKAAKQLASTTIDVLINNAAIVQRMTLEDIDFDSIREQFEVNAIGALRFTKALLPHLKAGSKLILMTSRMGSIDDNTSGSSYGYRMSKVALCMAGKSLSIDLKPRGIPVGILHPGLVCTRMTNFRKEAITTEESVNGLLVRIKELNLENSGTFWHANGQVLPW